MTKKKNHHADEPVEPVEPVEPPPSVELQSDVVDGTPEPLAAGPMPMGVAIMRVQKQRYRDWITAGGTPPIYT